MSCGRANAIREPNKKLLSTDFANVEIFVPRYGNLVMFPKRQMKVVCLAAYAEKEYNERYR